MVFSSIIFLFLFLPITILLYFISGKKFHNIVLLFASLIFYSWGENFYVLIMLLSITVNYFSGILIDHFRYRRLAIFFLSMAIILNLGLLSAFKYSNFIVDNINVLLSWLQINEIILPPVHLPIGISFFTFQALSYVVDIYRNDAVVQKNPINIGLYIASFPQLIAGPIVRYRQVADQLLSRSVNRESFAEGIRRFILGLAKKVLIANQMAVVSDKIFALSANDLTLSLAWMGIVSYTIQIYFDFSGYSDMAIGLGRLFGFQFPENFNYPYISKSVREFWQRWHITLSTWFRDYLYIPLGGNRYGKLRTYFNLVTVFFLCGLWHGASWNFVIWGMIHGLFIVIERIGFLSILEKISPFFRHIYALLIVTTAWVFFRVDTLPAAISYLSAMFGFAKGNGIEFHAGLYLDYETIIVLFFGIVLSTPLFAYLHKFLKTINSKLDNQKAPFLENIMALSNTILLSIIFLGSIMRLAAGAYNPFIYFRF